MRNRLALLAASPMETRITSARQPMSRTSLIQGSDLNTSARSLVRAMAGAQMLKNEAPSFRAIFSAMMYGFIETFIIRLPIRETISTFPVTDWPSK